MSNERSIQSLGIATRVADYLADCGYAYVEDDQLEGLDEVLTAFLQRAGIPVQAASESQERGWRGPNSDVNARFRAACRDRSRGEGSPV